MDKIVKRLDVIALLLIALAALVLTQAGFLNPDLIRHWYFHLPNFLLAALMYTLLGRVALGLIIDRNSQNYIWRFFCRVTDPVVRVVAIVTPNAAPPVIVWLLAFVWLFWIRVLFFAMFIALGLTPRI